MAVLRSLWEEALIARDHAHHEYDLAESEAEAQRVSRIPISGGGVILGDAINGVPRRADDELSDSGPALYRFGLDAPAVSEEAMRKRMRKAPARPDTPKRFYDAGKHYIPVWERTRK